MSESRSLQIQYPELRAEDLLNEAIAPATGAVTVNPSSSQMVPTVWEEVEILRCFRVSLMGLGLEDDELRESRLRVFHRVQSVRNALIHKHRQQLLLSNKELHAFETATWLGRVLGKALWPNLRLEWPDTLDEACRRISYTS